MRMFLLKLIFRKEWYDLVESINCKRVLLPHWVCRNCRCWTSTYLNRLTLLCHCSNCGRIFKLDQVEVVEKGEKL